MARPLFNTPALLTTPGVGAAATSPLPPLNPLPGQFWWRPTDGNLYVFYDDGTSRQWVPATAITGGATGSAGGSLAGSYPNPTLAVGATVQNFASIALPANYSNATTGAVLTVVTSPSITTRGAPARVLITVVIGGSVAISGGASGCTFALYRDVATGTPLLTVLSSAGPSGISAPVPSLTCWDQPPAGAHVYVFTVTQTANALFTTSASPGALTALEFA